MAVAHDAASQSHPTDFTGSTSEDSFSWTHTPTGTPSGVLVFVYTHTNADYITSVTYGGVAMTQFAEAADTAGEPGRCTGFFLGATIPTGAQSVVVTRTNNTTEMNAQCATVTASSDTATYDSGVVLVQESGTLSEQSVDDGSPGSNSVRYAGIFSGRFETPPAGANSTSLLSHKSLILSTSTGLVRETTAGQGSRSVGFSLGTTDDRAVIHVAVYQLPSTTTLLPRLSLMGVG